MATIAPDDGRARALDEPTWTASSGGDLAERVRQLEARLHMLRLSRRVLMNLLIHEERQHRLRLSALEARNRRLARANARLAERLLLERASAARGRDGEGFPPGAPND